MLLLTPFSPIFVWKSATSSSMWQLHERPWRAAPLARRLMPKYGVWQDWAQSVRSVRYICSTLARTCVHQSLQCLRGPCLTRCPFSPHTDEFALLPSPGLAEHWTLDLPSRGVLATCVSASPGVRHVRRPSGEGCGCDGASELGRGAVQRAGLSVRLAPVRKCWD